jgi:tight adherence protein C
VSAAVALGWAAWVLWLVVVTARPPARWPAVSGPSRRRSSRRRAAAAAGAVGALAVAVAGGPPLAALVVASAGLVVVARRRAERRRRARRAAACVPELGELLRIAVAAGLTPALALEQVAELGPEPGRSAVAAALAATRRGRPLGDALGVLVDRLGASVRPLVDALAATDRYGVPLEPVLDAAVADLRRQRRTAAQEAARRLPVTLSFPLVGCVLPAFALLTLAPLVAGAFESLRIPTSSTAPRLGPSGPPPTAPVGGPARVQPAPSPVAIPAAGP